MGAEQAIQQMQRSRGEAAVALARSGTRVGPTVLRQRGSAKAFVHAMPEGPEVVFLNTSGGLTGGDRLALRLDVGTGVTASATTQTAERAYRSAAGPARVDITMTVGAGARLDWLPQETILYQGASLDRSTVIDLEPGATLLALETVVLGRAAMGETLARVALNDWREVRVAGRPLQIEPLRLTPRALQGAHAGLGGARAIGTLIFVAPDAGDRLEPLRRIIDEPGVTAAASALPGRIMLRALADDAWPMRRMMARALRLLRDGRPLPRVWQN